MDLSPSSRGPRLLLAASLTLALLAGLLVPARPARAFSQPNAPVFINEIHYDNASTDVGEFIEVAGPAGTSLAGWSIVLYNGATPSAAAQYDSDPLPASIPDSGNGFGFVVVNYPSNGIQNGPTDAIALVNNAGQAVQFLSYEGPVTASNGPAAGLTSSDVGVSQGGSEPAGTSSLYLTGTGSVYQDFTWAATLTERTAGAVNAGQTFEGAEEQAVVINEFSASHTGTDTEEYVEIFGAPSTAYAGYTLLEIEGDSGAALGTIDEVIAVGSTDANGLWLAELANDRLENGSITLLLVEGFSGAINQDLDANNDGVFDSTPWTALADAVAVNDGGAGDRAYGTPALGPNYDGLSSFAPGGASRIPDGLDTDGASDWVRNDFELAGIPGFAGTAVLGEALNTPGAPNQVFEPLAFCADPSSPVSRIHTIQGSGDASPVGGQPARIEGVVVGDFQTNDGDLYSTNLDGFYLQEESADADADPATSEGIFVFAPEATDVQVGDLVRACGTVEEFNGLTELTNVETVEVLGAGALPAPAQLSFPLSSPGAPERYEGMLVELPQQLTIVEYFDYERFGELVLAYTEGIAELSGVDRFYTPTNIVEPGAPAQALAAEYALRRITLDDGRGNQNPPLLRHPNGEPFSLQNSFRGGDRVAGATGVLDYRFGRYRLQPTAPAAYTAVNERPAAPEPVGGRIQVGAFNTLNYFLTLDALDDGTGRNDNPADNVCGGLQNLDCRGADLSQPTEFGRQRAKLLEALIGLDAEALGLNELENTPGVEPLADIVAGLNDRLGAGTYAYIDTGAIGTDAIKVGIIYKPGVLRPVGDYAVLDSSVDPRFIDDLNRPALAQTFEEISTGARFTMVVNHLKSKGSDCNDVGDPDAGDGQGNCNGTREAAAQAIVDWLATDPTGSSDTDFLIVGDLNSYAKEDPIDAILAGADGQLGSADDFTNLIAAYGGAFAYSYVFDGQLGYLDHALANASLSGQVTGATEWHINADEPDVFDYDTSFKPAAQEALYEVNAFRTSDHDPVLVGLDLVHFATDGVLAPIKPDGSSVFKYGRTVPVKLQLQALDGSFPAGLAPQIRVALLSNGTPGPITEPGSSSGADSGGVMRFDPASQQYIYNFDTATLPDPAATYRLFITVPASGQVITADFSVRP